MRRTCLLILLCGSIVIFGCAKKVLVQPEVEMSKYNRLAILPFETDSFLSTIGHQLADEIVTELLKNAPKLDIVERARIDSLLQEQKLARGGYLNIESAIQAGRLLGVRAIITGSISVSVGDVFLTPSNPQRVAAGTATLRLIDTETGKILWAKREETEYAVYKPTSEDGGTTYSIRTDHEMIQRVIQDLGRLLAKAFYPHYELQY